MWKHLSFWQKFQATLSGIAGLAQLIFAANDFAHIYNYVTFSVQAFGIIMGIWMEDRNKNDIVDVFEKEVIVKVTSDTPIQTEVTVEKKENSGHGFTEGGDIK
jgi:hypothetical protein